MARPLTRLAEWVDALLEERRRPPLRSVFEAAMMSVSMPLTVTWSRPPQTAESTIVAGRERLSPRPGRRLRR